MRERRKTEQGDREDRDTLTGALRSGVRKLITQALNAEVAALLAAYQSAKGDCPGKAHKRFHRAAEGHRHERTLGTDLQALSS